MVRDEVAFVVCPEGQAKTLERLRRTVPSEAVGEPFDSRFEFGFKGAANY